ncbi:MAG TPA: hypothetical protein VJ873_00905, partial [bacterium]|nr:hypothetical protein [bacterium]
MNPSSENKLVVGFLLLMTLGFFFAKPAFSGTDLESNSGKRLSKSTGGVPEKTVRKNLKHRHHHKNLKTNIRTDQNPAGSQEE